MSVYKRGNIWWYKFQVNGKRVRQSTGQTSKRKAEEIERHVRDRLSRDKFAGSTGRPKERTFSEALLKWIETGAPKSMQSHARNVRPYMDGVMLVDAPEAADRMKADMLKRGLSNQTINRRLAVVRRVVNLAHNDWDWLDRPLAKKISLLSEKGCARETYLNQEEVKQLVDAIANPVARQVTLIAAYTGLRRSELLSLKAEHWKEPYIHLPSKTKTGRPRTVPVIKELHDSLELPFDITDNRLRREFEAARDAIERPDIRFHDLRHTFASWLAADPDIPLTVIRDLLGHSTLAMTSRYAHLRGDHAAKIERTLGTKVATVH